MGKLSSDLTDIKVCFKQKPYIEKAISDDPCLFINHSEYRGIADYQNVLNTDDYQKLAKAMDSTNDHAQCLIMCPDEVNRDLTEFAMGLASESGEFADEIRKHVFQGHRLDYQHLAEELGDIAWFLAMAANTLGYSLSDIFRMNIEKLIKRYPEGFDPERSVNRYEAQ